MLVTAVGLLLSEIPFQAARTQVRSGHAPLDRFAHGECADTLRASLENRIAQLDEQAEQIFAMTDDIAERVRKLGGTTIRSVGHIARLKHVAARNSDHQ